MNFLKRQWAKGWAKVVIATVVIVIAALTYLQFHSVRITLTLKPIPVPQDRLIQAFVAATEGMTVKGDAALRPSTRYIDGVKLKVERETLLEVSGVLAPESSTSRASTVARLSFRPGR